MRKRAASSVDFPLFEREVCQPAPLRECRRARSSPPASPTDAHPRPSRDEKRNSVECQPEVRPVASRDILEKQLPLCWPAGIGIVHVDKRSAILLGGERGRFVKSFNGDDAYLSLGPSGEHHTDCICMSTSARPAKTMMAHNSPVRVLPYKRAMAARPGESLLFWTMMTTTSAALTKADEVLRKQASHR